MVRIRGRRKGREGKVRNRRDRGRENGQNEGEKKGKGR